MRAVEERAEQVRRFNRFYTRRIGVLHEHLLDSAFSLTEVRILYELAHRSDLTGTTLCRELGLDAGYLSRVIAGFEKKGLVAKTRTENDARVMRLELTRKGRKVFDPLDAASRREVVAMLDTLPTPEQDRLVDAMTQVQALLGEARGKDYVLRDPRPGDMGWIVHRHGVLYAQEYGWDMTFEALVAEIVAKFVREFDPRSDHCWIAEKDGRIVGSVFVVRHDERTAKLRLLYVEPGTRGLGIGHRLVDECVGFARRSGYAKLVLWTNSVLTAARRIYEQAGFTLVEEEAHHSFGKDLVAQTWALDLANPGAPPHRR